MGREELKSWLRELERELGRIRKSDRYDPRTIDLDIVVWGGEIMDEDVYEREFLRAAILEVCPGLNI
jgi:2-amino-4-hydroxy-6-hydroxymethyldihydropteridine diphosphokinase